VALVPFPGASPSEPDDDRYHDELDDSGAKMSFLEHLDELRKRLIHSVSSILIGVLATFYFHQQLYDFIFEPTRRILPKGSKLIFTEPGEAFSLHMQIALISGCLAAAPYILYQLWLFIAPGLYSHEKKLAIPFVLLATIGCFAGALFNHYVVFPFMMTFFASFAGDDLVFMPKIDPVFSLYTRFLLAMCIVFQMPTLVYFLARMRVVTAGFLVKQFKYAILITFIVSAVITPTGDPWTQTVFAVPMIALYIISIGIAWLVAPRKTVKA
jgi:sec-independent protein translocase protein TatC